MADKVTFELVSPSRLLASEDVDMVVVPGEEGDFGVMPGHTPVLSTVRAGVVDIHNDGQVTKRLFVEGGFAEATDERCTVLAEEATPLDEITAEAAGERLAKAQEALNSADDESRDAVEKELRTAEVLAQAVGR
ncbi:MAG: ATP synthase F1 subunit epsilon [Rhodospirillaceae bacterium]|jgi:F-type H+-transporting ATPase subunit epsilon